MAKQTGQITVLKNNTVTNVEHQIRFIFTKENGERITRDTTAKGVINFDIPNGDWNVSWFAVDGDQKVLPLRAGLQLKITSSTPTTALADWIYGGNTHVADPILVQWTSVLDEMKKARNETIIARDEIVNNSIGDGKFLKEGAGGVLSSAPRAEAGWTLEYRSGFYSIGTHSDLPIPTSSGNQLIVASWGRSIYSHILFQPYNSEVYFRFVYQEKDSGYVKALHAKNTTVDSNGFIKAASPIIKLFDDRIETNDQFDKEPVFEKIAVGTYKISNTLGLAKEGWTYENPRGSDGNPYFRIVVEKTDDGCIVSVHDEYVDYEDKEIIDSDGNKRTVKERVTVLSAARDIQYHERWIDLRFHEEPQQETELLAEMEVEYK